MDLFDLEPPVGPPTDVDTNNPSDAEKLATDGAETTIWDRPDGLLGWLQTLSPPQDLPFPIDPEFSDDGYVVWQVEGDGFYLGQMDLDTGDFLGVVNYIAVPPTSIFVTIQAIEFIYTPEGVGAIGMSDQGLVYISETEAYVLEGTEGMRFTAMPKGEVPGIRFVAYSGTQTFLYDDGTITRLEIGRGQAWDWIDADELLIRNERTGAVTVLNVETMEQELVTEEHYSDGQAAAYTASNGDQYITLQGDGYRDIFIDTGDGWCLLERMVSPYVIGEQHWSAEFFEWNGRVFVMGFVADDLSLSTKGIMVIFDVERGTWSRVSGPETWRDPEVLVLDDETVAYYGYNTSDTSAVFNTIAFNRILLRGTPSGDIDASQMPEPAAHFSAPDLSAPNPDQPETLTFDHWAHSDSFDFVPTPLITGA